MKNPRDREVGLSPAQRDVVLDARRVLMHAKALGGRDSVADGRIQGFVDDVDRVLEEDAGSQPRP